jgi:hypothetical protein
MTSYKKKKTKPPTHDSYHNINIEILVNRTAKSFLGVPMRAVNNRPPTANRYNRQPPNRLTAITV